MYAVSALSYVASPVLSCIHGQTNGYGAALGCFLSPSQVLFSWQRNHRDRFCGKNYKLLYSPGSVFRNKSALQFGMDQYSCSVASGLCWFTHARHQVCITWCDSICEWAQLCFLSKCLICPAQNMHAEGPDPGQQLYKPKSYKLYCWWAGNYWAVSDWRNCHHTAKEVDCVTAAVWRVNFAPLVQKTLLSSTSLKLIPLLWTSVNVTVHWTAWRRNWHHSYLQTQKIKAWGSWMTTQGATNEKCE